MFKPIKDLLFAKVTILDRYIIREFWIPFFSGCAIITGVWLSADQLRQIFKLITVSKAPFSLAVTIIGLNLPEILVSTIPIGVLWGTFLVFSKLNNDSEIIAMRTSGISLARVLRPVILFGLITGGMTFFINEVVVPFSNPLARKLEIYSMYKNPLPNSKKNFFYMEKGSKGTLRRIFYAAKYNADKGLLKNIVILDFTKDGLTQIHCANTAHWSPTTGGWQLHRGTNHFISTDEELSRISSFDTFFIPSGSTPSKLLKEIGKPGEMNFIKLASFLQLQKNERFTTDSYNTALVTFHKKFSQPLACILIALVGAPLGILPRRSISTLNYIFLAMIIFQYYMMQSICLSLAENSQMSPFLASWLPNIVLLMIALFIVRQKAKLA